MELAHESARAEVDATLIMRMRDQKIARLAMPGKIVQENSTAKKFFK
jgi:hypothetical protein